MIFWILLDTRALARNIKAREKNVPTLIAFGANPEGIFA